MTFLLSINFNFFLFNLENKFKMQKELCEELYVKQFPLTMKIERLLRQFESGHHAVSVVEGITSDLIGCIESTKVNF